MERAEFEQIVESMQALNARDPEAYRRKVDRFATLGFVVFIGAFVAMLVLLGLIIWMMAVTRISGGLVKLVIIVGAVIVAFARSLVFRIPPPEGREVTAQDAPVLMRELERIRTMIGAPRIYKVLIDDDFNAFATSSTRFGFFGERCYVVLGLPLLLCLRKDEVMGVIGHELAHHSRSHVRTGVRAYRLESMWRQVLIRLSATGSLLTHPMAAFVRWYSPRFSAMSLVLRRQAEFEADAEGARATSRETMAIGLLRLTVESATRMQNYWKAVMEKTKASAAPNVSFFTGLLAMPHGSRDDVRQSVVRSLRSETMYEDSHPAKRERLRALGVPADPDEPKDVDALVAFLDRPGSNAAEDLLGERLPALLGEFDKKWVVYSKEKWEEAYQSYQESAEVLAKFADTDPAILEEGDARKWIEAYAHYHGWDKSTAETTRIASRFPQNGEIQLFAGYSLLESGDAAGIAYMEEAVKLDRRLETAAYSAIADFRAERGESRKARESALAASKAQETMSEKYERLIEVGPMGAFSESGADRAEVERLVALLPRLKRVKAAYSIRRTDAGDPTIFIDLLVLVLTKSVLVESVDEYTASEVKKAYELFGSTKGLYATAILEKTPLAKRLAERPDMKVYEAT